MHLLLRSNRRRETIPAAKLESLQVDRLQSPGPPDARSSLLLPQDNLGVESGGADKGQPSRGSLLKASFLRQTQAWAESFPSHRIAPAPQAGEDRSLAEKTLSKHFALEGETGQSKTSQKHPPTRSEQLDLDKFEHMMFKIEALEKVVRKFAGRRLPPTLATELEKVDCKQSSDNNNNNSNNNNHTDNNNNNTTTTNNNNNERLIYYEPNNYKNNKDSREPSLSLDLDNDNPESEDDLDAESLDGFNPGAVSSFGLDQHEANLSFNNLGHRTMAIGSSLGSLIQQQEDEQEGMQIGTAWEPSLMHYKPKKKVSFDETSLAHHRRNNGQKQQKGSHPGSFQLEQLGGNTEKQQLPAQNKTMKLPNLAGLAFSKPTCSNSLHQLGRRHFSMRNAHTTA